jgi:Tol biopolymer transport system component
VTHNGGFCGEVSPDGKWLYYSVPTKGLWKMPPDGGEATQVLAPPLLPSQYGFGLAADGMFAIGTRQPEGYPVVFYSFDGGAPRTLTTLNRPALLFTTVSPDGRWFLYSSAGDPKYEIMQVDNFR